MAISTTVMKLPSPESSPDRFFEPLIFDERPELTEVLRGRPRAFN
jgi:hypothetical protein